MAFFDKMENYDRLLYKAVNSVNPLMVFCNLTADSYQIISYSKNVLNDSLAYSGKYTSLITEIFKSIENKDYSALFSATFNREKVLSSLEYSDSLVFLQFPYKFNNGKEQWIMLQLIFVGSENSNDVEAILLGRNIKKRKMPKSGLKIFLECSPVSIPMSIL